MDEYIKKFKKGSGIHIKEKNKGTFTKWCGGNVTEECIRRGKNSPNPKIRKKATFADNARHFKHRLGGKAFVNGVNVLDSDPKAYKYVKKKIKSAGDGDKLDLTPLDLNTLYKKYKEIGNNRYIDTLLLRQLDNQLIKRKMGKPQRQAISVTAGQEGSTIKSHGNGAAGLVGWRGVRAENLPNTAEGQADKIYDETYGPFSNDNWNHGGQGSGYKTAREAQQAFQNAVTPEEAIKALNFGYVRPPKSETLYRINLMKKLYKKGGLISKAQEGTKFTQWLSKNSGLIEGGLNLLGNGLQTISNQSKIRKFSNEFDDATKAQVKAAKAKAINAAYQQGLQIAPYLNQYNAGDEVVNNSDIANRAFAWNYANTNADQETLNEYEAQRAIQKQQAIENMTEAIQGSGTNYGKIFTDLAGQLGQYIGNKNNAPSVVTPIKDYAKDFKQKTNPSIKDMNFKVAMITKDPTYRL